MFLKNKVWLMVQGIEKSHFAIVVFLLIFLFQTSIWKTRLLGESYSPYLWYFFFILYVFIQHKACTQVSLLLICIKDEVARVWPTNSQHRGILSNDGDSAEEAHQVQAVVSPFVSEEVLRVVGTVLRPTAGLPLDFCTHIDPVSFFFSSCTLLWLCTSGRTLRLNGVSDYFRLF